MACSEGRGGGGAGEVDAGQVVFGGGGKRLAQGVEFGGGELLQLVELLSHLAFLLGRNAAEVVEESRNESLLAEIFDADLLDLFGRGGCQTLYFFP